MRIAFLNWNNRKFGGTGSYLSTIMPVLHAAGHDVALWHEVDAPSDYPLLPVPVNAPVWSVASLGLNGAIDALRNWQPDLLYAHGLLEPSVEEQALDVAPAVFFAHDYYGTCINGQKTLTRPIITPCHRTFGWQCIAEYYPKRCGGLSPMTMVRQFRRQQDRLHLLRDYAAIVTHSDHMKQEYEKHGLATRVYNVKCSSNGAATTYPHREPSPLRAWRLLFVGRMDPVKGGSELIRSLREVRRRLNRPLHLAFAGDGPALTSWEVEASALRRVEPEIEVTFHGWLATDALDALYADSDLLVVPSLWPEPLALVGLEAGRHGLPTVAFDVGGISDWLKSGTNGILAPGDPPTVDGLANAMVAALEDPAVYKQLCHGAQHANSEFTLDEHLRRLTDVFETVVR